MYTVFGSSENLCAKFTVTIYWEGSLPHSPRDLLITPESLSHNKCVWCDQDYGLSI